MNRSPSTSAALERRIHARRNSGISELLRKVGGTANLQGLLEDAGCKDLCDATLRNWASGRHRPQRGYWPFLYRVAEEVGVDLVLEKSNEKPTCAVPGCNRKRQGTFCNTHWKRIQTHGDPLASIPIGKLVAVNSDISEERRQEMVAMRRAGKTLAEIGERFGLSKQRCFQVLKTDPSAPAGTTPAPT